MKWYRRITPKRSKADRLRDVSKARGGPVLRHRSPVKIRVDKQLFFKTFSRKIWLNGYGVKVCSRYLVAKYFDVPLQTIHNWDRHGVLPEPFMMKEGPKGLYPLYLASQIRVLRLVVADLVKDGYVSIPWKYLPDHIAMLHEGYAAALKAFQSRYMEAPESDKYGNVFFD